jgi:hypothetical protein
MCLQDWTTSSKHVNHSTLERGGDYVTKIWLLGGVSLEILINLEQVSNYVQLNMASPSTCGGQRAFRVCDLDCNL